MLPKSLPKLRAVLRFEGLIRLLADVILINLSIVTSLSAELFYYLATSNPADGKPINYSITFWSYLNSYIRSAWLLTLICVIVFFLSGFYTYGRFYRGRYKILIVAQAVSIAYLVFGLLVYILAGGARPNPVYLPRAAFVLSWVLSLFFLVTARAWSLIWKNLTRSEQKMLERPGGAAVRGVLVIGGAGYIGSALLPKLLEKGYHVTLLDLLLYGTEPIQSCLNHPNLKVMQADFRQVDKVVEAMRDVDAVIHLGALVGDPACALDADLTTEINLMGTRMIAEVAKGSNVARFIFASTCSVYGASDEKLDERSTLNPVSLYARSKIASEKVLIKMADEHFAPVILRFGTVYGLSGRTRFDLVVNLLTAKAVCDGQITIFGGDQWRPFVHVDDVAVSLMEVLEAPLPLVRNQILNVGSNEQNYTIKQVGQFIHEQVPAAEITNVDSDYDPRNYWVDFTKINHLLGFKPNWTIEKGVQQVIQAIQSGKVGDYRDARYSNVKFLTEEGLFRLIRHEEGWASQLINDNDFLPIQDQ